MNLKYLSDSSYVIFYEPGLSKWCYGSWVYFFIGGGGTKSYDFFISLIGLNVLGG